MVKEISSYEADDGTIFHTLEEAQAYEHLLEAKGQITDLFTTEFKGRKLPIKQLEEVVDFIIEYREYFKQLL